MAGKTPRLGLNYLDPSQAQPEVPLNENVDILDEASGSIWVEALGSSPGEKLATKLIFANCLVEVGTDGTVTITPEGGGSGRSGSPLDVTDGTNSVLNATAIRFINGASVSEASAGVAEVYVDPVSGGSVGRPNVTPDTHPSSPDPIDDEFEATSLNGKWAWLNQGSVTDSFHEGSIILTGTTDGLIHAITQAAPATPYTVTGKVCIGASAGGSGTGVGLIAYNSANSHLYAFLFDSASGPLACYAFNSPTSFNGVLFSALNLPVGTANLAHWIYLQISNDGTTLTFFASQTGIPGTFQPIGSVLLATLIGAVTDIGIVINNNVAGAVCVADYLRRMA